MQTHPQSPQVLHNLKEIPNYGKHYWDFSHPEEPLDLNTLPGFENIVYDTNDIEATPCNNELTANEICSPEVNTDDLTLEMMSEFKEIESNIDVANAIPLSQDNEPLHAFIDDENSLIDCEITTSDTNWLNTNKLAKSTKSKKKKETKTNQLLRKHPFITPENLHSLAKKRLDAFNVKPGHIIKFIHYGLGILHPTYSWNIFLSNSSYTCADCSDTFKWKWEYQLHSLIHSGGSKSILCISCSKDFWSKHEFIRHCRTHNNSRPFVCSICNKNFKCKASLMVHRKNKHSFEAITVSERMQKDYICPECYVICDTNKILQTHMDLVHQAEESFAMQI